MKISPRTTSSALFCAALFTATAILAQTAHPAAHTAAHPTTASHTGAAAGGCITIPDLSPNIPAVPAGSPCPKALYTMTTMPDIHLDYVAPVEGDLAKSLGIEPVTFALAYIDTKVGTAELAQPHKWYTVKYTGYLADGTVFDAYDKHPETADGYAFPIGAHQVVAGWDTGFAGMKVGGKRRLFIPFQLAYGPSGRPPTIPARAELIFDMELVSQSDTQPAPKTTPATAAPKPTTSATPPATINK